MTPAQRLTPDEEREWRETRKWGEVGEEIDRLFATIDAARAEHGNCGWQYDDQVNMWFTTMGVLASLKQSNHALQRNDAAKGIEIAKLKADRAKLVIFMHKLRESVQTAGEFPVLLGSDFITPWIEEMLKEIGE